MNNVEALGDFIKLLKESFPNIQLDKRDEMLLGMAINHAYLIKREEINKIQKELEIYKDIADSCNCDQHES